MQNPLVIKQFAAGQEKAYGQLAGITFRGTSNPKAQVPEEVCEYNISSVNDYIMQSSALKGAFPE